MSSCDPLSSEVEIAPAGPLDGLAVKMATTLLDAAGL
jgi:hypothetical protein